MGEIISNLLVVLAAWIMIGMISHTALNPGHSPWSWFDWVVVIAWPVEVIADITTRK